MKRKSLRIKITSTEWIIEVMSQAAKEQEQDGIQKFKKKKFKKNQNQKKQKKNNSKKKFKKNKKIKIQKKKFKKKI